MRTLLLLSMLLLIPSCIKKVPEPMCKSVFKAVTATANIIATTLQCEDPAAIAGDLSAHIVGLGLCADTAQQSTLSDLICPQLSTLVASMATSSIPAHWQCSATVMTELIKSQITSNCVGVIK